MATQGTSLQRDLGFTRLSVCSGLEIHADNLRGPTGISCRQLWRAIHVIIVGVRYLLIVFVFSVNCVIYIIIVSCAIVVVTRVVVAGARVDFIVIVFVRTCRGEPPVSVRSVVVVIFITDCGCASIECYNVVVIIVVVVSISFVVDRVIDCVSASLFEPATSHVFVVAVIVVVVVVRSATVLAAIIIVAEPESKGQLISSIF